jgi:ferrous iron transport protein B
MFRAGKIIVPMVVVISFLNSWGTDGSFGHDNTDQSMLSEVGRTLTPVFEPMGIHQDNWPATVGIFTGVLAKEAVVGTLDAIYAQLAIDEAMDEATEAKFSLVDGLSEAFASIPANLAAVGDTLLDPLGIQIGDVSDQTTAAEDQAVSTGTFGAMAARFDGQVGAFAYLLFILMYFPCAAAIAAFHREAGWRWTAFIAIWTTGLGYISAILFYQLATFAQHPAQSMAWSVGLLVLSGLTILTLRWMGQRHRFTVGQLIKVPA